ncbi:MAG: hypothetical protein AAGB10_22280 [Pseudomonadota bacterium]
MGRYRHMIVGRTIGWVFLAIAILCLIAAASVFGVKATGHEFGGAASLGQLWFQVNSAGLNLTQAIIQRYVWPYLWDPIIQSVLLMPLEQGLLTIAATTGAIGLVLSGLFRNRNADID